MAASNDDILNDTSFSTGSYRSLETSQQLHDDDDDSIVPETPPSNTESSRREDGSRQEADKPPRMSHQNAESSRATSTSKDLDTPPFGSSSVRSLARSGPPSGASSKRSSGSSNSRASSIRSTGSSISRADETTIPIELQELEMDRAQKENVHKPVPKSEERSQQQTDSEQCISKGVSASTPNTSKPRMIQNPFIASTPVMSSNRKLMNAQVFSNLDITNINFERVQFGHDEDSSSEDEGGAAFNQTRGVQHRSSSSSDVRAVSSSEADESSGDVQVVDEYVGEDEVLVGAVAPVRQQDIDFLTDKMRLQTLQNKKPLMKFIEEPPGPPQRPLADKHQNYKTVPLAAGATEWMDDVTKALDYLVNSAKQMPNPLEDPIESEFVSPKRLRVDLFPYQKYGVRWMSWRESNFPYGGILADEMGLGKTVMVMSVVLQGLEQGHNQEDEVENWLTPISRKLVPTQATLVVCPASCMKQWESELTTKAKGLRVYVYHGAKRTDSAAVLSQHHVVICPYSTITSEIPKPDDDPYNKCRSPLLRLHWSRIVLDEGHIIRNPKTAGSLAICRIEAKRRWVVTGTPIHNKADDFYSLIKFLKLKPFDDKSCWKFWIGGKALSTDGVARLHLIGNAVTLRRVKAEITNCEIAKLPPKAVEDIVLELSEEERSVYDHLEAYAKEQYENYVALQRQNADLMQNAASNFIAGSSKKGKADQDPNAVKFSHLFALILRLRQMSILPFLIKTMLGEEEEVSDDESYDAENDPVNKNNPIFQIGYKSSKIRRVLHDVEEIRKSAKPGQPMDKIIIVSQWTTLLSIVQQHLEKRNYRVVTITGQDSFEERAAAMSAFNSNLKRPEILLLSLVAGGVGLNLVGGNYVFFLEPHWNPQLERQAQDRVHRYGQKKPVTIRRYICERTIESRVLELQQEKLKLADGLLDSTKKVSTGAGLNMNDMKSLFGLGNKATGRVRPPRK